MQKVDLRADKKIDNWLKAKNKTKNTENSYIQGMYFYTELTGRTPEELLEEAKNEQRSNLMMMDRKILQYLNNYLYFLEDRKLAPKTIHSYIGAIRSFYRKEYIEVPDLDLKKAKPTNRYKKIPTKQDLQDVLQVCEPLEKAIILTGVSSGLSDIDIVNLKISDFKNGYDSDNKITILQLSRHKLGVTAKEFITFLSPEATTAINDYLNFRNRECKVNFKRENDRLDKQKIRNNGYLFIKKHIRDSYLKTGNEEERKITDTNLIQIYREISEKARKNTPFGDWNIIRSHNMRKYFYNVLINHKCPFPHAEYMMGHELDSVRGAYYIPTVEELKISYLECVPYLTIQKELDISESPIFLKMKEHNTELEKDNYIKNVERDELVRMKAEYEKQFEYIKRLSYKNKLKTQLNTAQIQRIHATDKNKIEYYDKMIARTEELLKKCK